MIPCDSVRHILAGRRCVPVCDTAQAFAPINIALIKYWGKRDTRLNLPTANSLSLTFPGWGTTTTLRIANDSPILSINDELASWDGLFGQRLRWFLQLFPMTHSLSVETWSNIPIGAGLASSASGFAALVLALDRLYGWNLDQTSLSCLARLGSGSACRSFWPGFVLWQKGIREDGLDSHGVSLSGCMPQLSAGIILVKSDPKPLNSRNAMAHTQKTSPYYAHWMKITEEDLSWAYQALRQDDFPLLGQVTERNALSLHWVMQTGVPPICYKVLETFEAVQRVYALRERGVSVYWTQDAGPNLKLLFLTDEEAQVKEEFPELLVSHPFRPHKTGTN